MHRFTPYTDIIMYSGLFVFFMVMDAILYYGYGRHHSKVPFVLFGLLTVVVLCLAGAAAYQTHKHRDDDEPW